MGYKDRSRLMDAENKGSVVTNTGIVYPTILLDGKLQATWKKDGEKLVITPFAKISQKNRKLITTQGRKLFAGEIEDVAFQV